MLLIGVIDEGEEVLKRAKQSTSHATVLLFKLVIENKPASRVKWIVSSRNWHEVNEQLRSAAGKAKLCLELDIEFVSAAVNTYNPVSSRSRHS
ncbi:hypothetical protein V8C43DRAFT_316000 [Trichoderma afarasin]